VSFRVSVAREAEKILDRIDRPLERRVRARFVQLADDPFDPGLSAPLTDRPGI
jgi:mRNA-degrading endonuclease RelE of RelBE toxin-antitoxin system